MHRYRIVAQVSLILSIFNLVLAAPTVVHWQKIHEARADETVVASDGQASPQSSQASPQHSSDGAHADEMVVPDDAESASNGPTSPQSSPASPQHSSDGAGADEMVVAEDTEAASDRLTSPQSFPASPQHSSDGSPSLDYPTPPLSETSSGSASDYLWLLDRPQRPSPNRPASFQGFAPAPQLTGSDRATTEPEGLVPPPTETPPDNAEFFNKNRVKKITEVAIVGGVTAVLALSLAHNIKKKKKHRDFLDS